jgi:hypothetical protein
MKNHNRNYTTANHGKTQVFDHPSKQYPKNIRHLFGGILGTPDEAKLARMMSAISMKPSIKHA